MRNLTRIAPLAALLAAAPATAWTTIDLFPNIGPPSVASHGVYEPGFEPTPSLYVYGANAVGAMLDNQLSRGGSQADTPGAFNTKPNFFINYDDFRKTEFHTWHDKINPAGAFAGEKGSVWRVGVRIESSTAFTAAGLTWSSDSPFGSESATLADLLLHNYPEGGFDPTLAVGIYYGADGVRGTADDVVCDNLACDPLTQQFNLLVWRGSGQGEQLLTDEFNSIYGGDWQALRADDRFYYSGGYGDFVAPFRIYQTFSVADANGDPLGARNALGIVTGVPEPSNWAMLLASFGLTGAALRRVGRRRQAVRA